MTMRMRLQDIKAMAERRRIGRPRPLFALVTAVIVSGITLSISPGILNAQEKQPALPAAERLEKLQEDLERSRKRRESLEQEAEALEHQRSDLREALIAKAAQVQNNERGLTIIEARLAKLRTKREAIDAELEERRKTLSSLLAGLQRLQRNPPPALAVRPSDALSAVRSAMLLGTVVPEVRAEAANLAKTLANLNDVRESIGAERSRLNDVTAALTGERKEMKELLAAKQTASEMTRAEIETEKKRSQEMARKSKSLQDLIARLGADVRTTGVQEPAASENNAKSDRRQVVSARAFKPTVPFSQAQGRLSMPVSGRQVLDFGARDDFGGSVKGISTATRAHAQVTSPADGKVAFAGSFRGYGQLLIIDAGEGYHLLLAGMDRINVNVGQFVLAGEPVGNMGQNAAESTVIGAALGNGGPILYVELRKDGEAIDSDPWWAQRQTKVSG